MSVPARSPSPAGDTTPVEMLYILGTTRSGTSALRLAFKGTRFRGYGEGHLVPILTGIANLVETQHRACIEEGLRGNGLYRLDEDMLMRELILGYERYLAAHLRATSIIDKTPKVAPIRAAPFLNRFHSKARFIHCSRRHVDNIQSKLKKFPSATLEQHCTSWAQSQKHWLKAKQSLEGNFLEIEFLDLVTDQAGVSARIGAYLELEPAEVGKIATYLINERPQTEADRDLTRYLKLSELGWSDADRATFLAVCGPVGERLGYGLETYHA